MDKGVFFAAVFCFAVALFAGAAYAVNYSAAFSISQHEVSTCPAGGGQLVFANIKNTGSVQDSYYLTAGKDWIIMPEITLNPGEETSVGILVAIGDPTVTPGRYPVDITLQSGRSKNTYKETITVKTLDCAGVSLKPEADTISGCISEATNLRIAVKNLGNVNDTFDVSATKGTLSDKTVSLGSGETKNIILSFSPQEGVLDEITVDAVSEMSYARASAKVSFVGRKCYSASVSVTPAYVKTCMEEGAALGVKVSNTGERPDVFTLTTNEGNLSQSSLNVPANDSKTAVLTIKPTKTGTIDITVDAVSPNTKAQAQAQFESEKCYMFSIAVVPENMSSSNYSGLISTIVLNNTGIRQDKYTISLEGVPWMEVAPEEVSVDPNSTKKAYVYITPVFGTENGTYTAKIIVASETSRESQAKRFDFTFGTVPSNVTVPPVTGGATKAISKKVIYALIIGLAIVLVILFGREYRKTGKEKPGKEGEKKEEKETKAPEKKEKKEEKEKKEKKGKKKEKKEVNEDIREILEGI